MSEARPLSLDELADVGIAGLRQLAETKPDRLRARISLTQTLRELCELVGCDRHAAARLLEEHDLEIVTDDWADRFICDLLIRVALSRRELARARKRIEELKPKIEGLKKDKEALERTIEIFERLECDGDDE